MHVNVLLETVFSAVRTYESESESRWQKQLTKDSLENCKSGCQSYLA